MPFCLIYQALGGGGGGGPIPARISKYEGGGGRGGGCGVESLFPVFTLLGNP